MSYKSWDKHNSYKDGKKESHDGYKDWDGCCGVQCNIKPGYFKAPKFTPGKFCAPQIDCCIPKFKVHVPKFECPPCKVLCKPCKPVKSNCGGCNIGKNYGKSAGGFGGSNGLFF